MSGQDTTEAHLRTLMIASLDGDAAAYRTLLSELGRHLRPYFTRRLHAAHASYAEDLVQDTLLAIHTRRMSYERDRPFTAWLHAVAHHKFVDHVRRHKLRITVPLDDDAPVFAHDDATDATAKRDLNVVLQNLPPRTEALIRKVRVEGSSIAEAAEQIGISETAAKVSIHRGLKALVARFSGGSDDR